MGIGIPACCGGIGIIGGHGMGGGIGGMGGGQGIPPPPVLLMLKFKLNPKPFAKLGLGIKVSTINAIVKIFL